MSKESRNGKETIFVSHITYHQLSLAFTAMKGVSVLQVSMDLFVSIGMKFRPHKSAVYSVKMADAAGLAREITSSLNSLVMN